MVWFQRRSGLALKPRRSSFDAWAGRASSFDTSSMRANRPIPPPPVVEDVVPGMSSPTRVETQAIRPRRTRGRFFGLKLKLPLFGSKDDDKRSSGLVQSPRSETFWRRCQTASDASDDEREKVRRMAEARKQILQESRARSGACDIPVCDNCKDDDLPPCPPSRLQGLPPPAYPGTLDFVIVSPVCVRNAQSLDIPSGDCGKMQWHIGRAEVVGRVEEGSAGFRTKPAETKSTWSQLASRRVFSMASRFRRKSREQRQASQDPHRPPTGCPAAELPPLYQPNQQAEADRRQSIGMCMGSNNVAYDTPGPEGPRCPPDNVYIPSGPPDSIYVCSGDTDRCLSLDSPMTYMPHPVVDAHPPSGSTSMGSYQGRWSSESIFVQPAQLALWDVHDDENKVYYGEVGVQSIDNYCQKASEGGAAMQIVGTQLGGRQSADKQSSATRSVRCQMHGNAVPRRSGFEGIRPGQDSGDVLFGCGQKSQDNQSRGSSGSDMPNRQSRAHKAIETSMAKKIFSDCSGRDAVQQLSDVLEHPIFLAPSVESDLSLRPQTPLSEDSSDRDCTEPVSNLQQEEEESAQSSIPDDGLCLQGACLVDSLECWNRVVDKGDTHRSASLPDSEKDSEAQGKGALSPVARPSISLSDPRCDMRVDRADQHTRGCYGQATPSDGSMQVANHMELAASYTSDGPLYHRSMCFDTGFTSAEESDDDLDGSQRFTPSQFTLKLKKSPQHHRRWHSDCLQGISAFHNDEEEDVDYRSHSHYRLDRVDRLEEIMSDYSRSFGDYPEEPGFSLRTGTDSDMVLPEFDDIDGHSYGRYRGSVDGGKKPKKSWLDELQEGAELRRKECTYRIACQRAIMQSMKETMQASKLAFERLKSGLCPQLTAKVSQLRRRWGGKRRAKRREKLVKAAQREEDELLADIPLVMSGCGLLRAALK